MAGNYVRWVLLVARDRDTLITFSDKEFWCKCMGKSKEETITVEAGP